MKPVSSKRLRPAPSRHGKREDLRLRGRFSRGVVLFGAFCLAAALGLGSAAPSSPGALAQQADGAIEAPPPEEGAAEARRGHLVHVPLPLDDAAAEGVRRTIRALVDNASDAGRRIVVVLQFGEAEGEATGRGSRFESSLGLARFLSGDDARRVRSVAYVPGVLAGHAVLPVLACDELVVTPTTRLGNAAADETTADEAVELIYQTLAARRGLLPEPVVRAMIVRADELVRVTRIDGTERFASGEELERLRSEGEGWEEERISAAGEPAVLTGTQLRRFRWAGHLVEDTRGLADALGVAELRPTTGEEAAREIVAARVDLLGSINPRIVGRLESNLAAASDQQGVNTVLLSIDSPGGNLEHSVRLGGTLAAFLAPGRRVAGYVTGVARGDASLVALACRPLHMAPDARLGGPGAETIRRSDLADLAEAVDAIATATRRPPALVRGLLDPTAEVFRYTDRRTGRVAYFIADEVPQEEADRWERGPRIELAEGIDAAEAVRLGLAEAVSPDLQAVATSLGLDAVPPPLSDRAIVRFVERLGRMPGLAPLLLFVGFMALSVELGAPGLGVPGFISMLSFMLFFWMKFLAGTAEWLEVLLFTGGILCLLIEVLVVPGVGIFGIGGLLMVIASIVMVSQTFVLPRNPYQYEQMTRSLMMVLAAGGGILGGFLMLRWLLPNTPMFRHLMMNAPDAEELEEMEHRESLVHWEHLLGQRGEAITPLRPAGKARFGDEIVAVVTDGTPLSAGDPIEVIEVHGNRVVVESIAESER